MTDRHHENEALQTHQLGGFGYFGQGELPSEHGSIAGETAGDTLKGPS